MDTLDSYYKDHGFTSTEVSEKSSSMTLNKVLFGRQSVLLSVLRVFKSFSREMGSMAPPFESLVCGGSLT